MGSQSDINLIVELSNKTIIPIEIWVMIFEIKDDFEFQHMKYVFSNEYYYKDDQLQTKLRSGAFIQRSNTGGAKFVNRTTQLVGRESYKQRSYFKIKGLFNLTKDYYIWLYKREKWNCKDDCLHESCAPWCKLSQERKEKYKDANWNKLFNTLDRKIDEFSTFVMKDVAEYERLLPVKEILHQKVHQDEECSKILEYETMMKHVKNIYTTMPLFLECNTLATKLQYFKHVYFKNWKNCQMTQRDFQFELSIYKPTQWKKYNSKCRHLRNGTLVGPKLYGMKFLH